MRERVSAVSVAIVIGAASTSPALAQFTGQPLLASFEGDSQVLAIENGILGGLAYHGQLQLQPTLWASITSEPLNMSLTPDLSPGRISAVSGGRQFGRWGPGAAGWNGTAASYVNLHPAGMNSSEIFAAHSGRQAGYSVYNAQTSKATLWTGATR